MSSQFQKKNLGFFTRLLDDVSAEERYQIATNQILLAESLGYDTAWIAQHHFDKAEGGLPSPFVFLAAIGAKTQSIHLGTAVITLSFENPVRVIEDFTVLDILNKGRIELGIGSGATDSTFTGFGLDPEQRQEIFSDNLNKFNALIENAETLYPQPKDKKQKIWIATFSEAGAARAGALGYGLMLSRTQPRGNNPDQSLVDIQNRLIDRYIAALPAGIEPRIMVSRTVLAVDVDSEGERWLNDFTQRFKDKYPSPEPRDYQGLNEFITLTDAYYGNAEQVEQLLRADTVLQRATHIAFQSHTIEPHYSLTNRSIEILIGKIAQNLGWRA